MGAHGKGGTSAHFRHQREAQNQPLAAVWRRGWRILAGVALAGGVQATPIVAVCEVGIQSGDFTCYDTAFESPQYLDCTDGEAPPIGSADRGGGVLLIGGPSLSARFAPNRRVVYEWSGRQAQAGGVAFALVGVDEDRIYGDGMDRTCTSGRFWP